MKKFIFICLFVFGSLSVCQSQEWMTSLEVAKSLAYVQDKLLFVVWEDVAFQEYPVLVKNDEGEVVVNDLFKNETINEVVWEQFVPVIVNEHNYEKLFNDIKGKRDQLYIDKFNDDTIKIMDVNGNIINTTIVYYDYLDIAKFIFKYALNTSFLKAELGNYRGQKDFNTTYRLATKYIDFAILVKEDVRPEIVKLSSYYLKEAEDFISNDNSEKFKQKIDLQKIKQLLVLGKPKKVLRQLKRKDMSKLDDTNKAVVAFLYYTSYLLLKDENRASEWRSKVSLVNLKKANLILNNKS